MPTLATSRSQNNLLKRSPPRARKSSNGANQAHHPSKGVNPRVTRSRSSMDLEANEKVDDGDETSGITSLDDETDGEGAEKMEERKIVSPRRRLTRALSGNMGGVPLFALDSPSPVLARKNRMKKRALRSPSRKARVRVLSPIVNIPHNRSPFPPRKKRITNLSPYHRSMEASPSSSSAPSGSPREQEYEEESTTDEDLDFEDRPVRAGTKRKRMGTQENGRSLRRRRSSGIGVGMRVLKKGKGKEKLKEEPPSSGASWVSTSTEVDGEQLDEDVDMDEFLLKTSTMSQLHRQRKSSLQRLVSALPSSRSSNALTSTMTKDDLVAAILSARSSLPSTSAIVSISPSAARDVSPSPPPTVKKPNAKQIPPSLDSGDLVTGKKKGRTTSTPFKFEDSDALIKGTALSRSKSMGDLKGKSSKFDPIRELGVDGGCTRMTRAQEKKEKKELRNGKFVGVGAKGKAKEAKKRKVTFSELPEESDEPETSEDDAEEWRESGMEDEEEEEEEEEEEAETDTNEDDEGLAPPTPIARRTRAGSGLVRQESSPNIGGLYITRKKAKKTIDDPSEEEDEEEETGESEGMDVDEEEEVAPKKGRKNSVQPETLPSESEEVEEEEEEEADEGEEEDVTIREDDGIGVDESVEEELTAGRVLRTLRNGKIIVTEDEGEQEEVEEEEEEEGSEEDENMEGVEIDLSIATRASLLRLRRDDLVALCESQELDFEGTKKQLVSRLLKSVRHHLVSIHFA
ncbi:hypothetical protein BT69DRAFT_406522 [Atractiella rhizophila]|nr:hypothetical protein BT69DRAFT_406522 [Atractiella rhizophila]